MRPTSFKDVLPGSQPFPLQAVQLTLLTFTLTQGGVHKVKKQSQMNLSIIKKISSVLSIAILTLAAQSASAQSYKLPGQHTQNSQDRLANQTTVKSNTFATPSVNYFNSNSGSLDLEVVGNGEIYQYGWDSGRVNCYGDYDVPQRANIDVSDFAIPHPGMLTSPYGYRARFGRMHRGVDLRLNVGDTVRAAFDGRVRITNYEAKGYGNYVVLRHYNQLETVYGHLSKFLVKDGQEVKAGQPIALGGNTGHSTGPHLHFETRYMGYAINPQAIFDFGAKTVHTDVYTFDKSTYQNARNFGPKSNNSNVAQAKPKAQPQAQTQNAQTAKAKATAAAAVNATKNNKATTKNDKAAAKAKSATPASKSVSAKKGDSLSKIAARNNTTVDRLCKLNGIKSSATLQPGQSIRVN